MSDSLTVFGIDYTGVTGIKAKGTGNGTLAYIRPQGTKSISANGTGIDVAAYSTVDVSVPSQESVFVITVSYNSQTQMWEPDCTYAEVAAAYQAGKELVAEGPTIDDMVAADCIWNADQSVLYYMVYFLSSSTQWACRVYSLSSNGIELAWDDSISTPTGTINITASGNTDVAQYATASVPNTWLDLGLNNEYYTDGGNRKWRARPVLEVWDAGWLAAGTEYGAYTNYNAIAANTTVTPSTSAQTIGGANCMMEGAVTVSAMPSGTAGTPTATKGTVSNHVVSVTPSVTNSTGYITGGTKTGTAVSVSASELVSGTLSITSSGTADVTNYASASVAAGGATASATKGTVSNHSVTVTPSVTRTAGYVTAGTSNGTAVTVSASELVSGSETKTANGTYDVTNLASLVVALDFVTYYTSSSNPTSSQGSNGDIWLVV